MFYVSETFLILKYWLLSFARILMFQKMSLTFKFGNSNISHIKHEYMKAFFYDWYTLEEVILFLYWPILLFIGFFKKCVQIDPKINRRAIT